jgi:hypothetical protein
MYFTPPKHIFPPTINSFQFLTWTIQSFYFLHLTLNDKTNSLLRLSSKENRKYETVSIYSNCFFFKGIPSDLKQFLNILSFLQFKTIPMFKGWST